MTIFDYHDDMTSKQQHALPATACFIIVGYGIPKDILQDQNYDVYLRTAFNKIFDHCAHGGDWSPTIIFSGGKTDMWKPYRRVEAREMMRAFKLLMQRPVVKQYTKAWKLIPEMKSLSTLDNFLYVKELFDQGKIRVKTIGIFCEQTRELRLRSLAKKFFKGAKVYPVDFDQSANRYLDPAKMLRITREGLKFDLWALKNETNLAKHRALFKGKIQFLREAGPDVHVEAVRQWWDKQLEKVDKGL